MVLEFIKLWSTAGEKSKKAIQPEVIGEYAKSFHHGQLKYVDMVLRKVGVK